MTHKVSLIIPAFNEEAYIHRSLESGRRQVHPPDEIIVVANGCTDRTAEVAERYTPHVYELESPEVSRAKNVGAAKATGDIIAFLDADTAMTETVLREAVENIDSGRSVGGKAPLRPDVPALRARILFTYVNSVNAAAIGLSNISDALGGLPQSGAGAFMFSSREAAERIRGDYGNLFDEYLDTMEDVDFTRRLREVGKLAFLRSPVITSTRRYAREGYASAFLHDLVQYLFPTGRKRDVYR